MPGPSQAGKFKPRKPAKKIKVGAAAAASVVPDATSSSTAAAVAAAARSEGAAASAAAAGGRGRGGRDGGRGGGREASGRGESSGSGSSPGGRGARGGRGGRGRGPRAPLPQGQVFFTAAPPPSRKGSAAASKIAVGSNRSASTSGAGGGAAAPTAAQLLSNKPQGGDAEASEEVVGQMEKGIGARFGDGAGASGPASKRRLGGTGGDEYDEDYMPSTVLSSTEMKGPVDGANRAQMLRAEEQQYMYDSDSSAEEALPRPPEKTLPPTRLPFPVAPLPVGVGADPDPDEATVDKDTQRPFLYDNQQDRQQQQSSAAMPTREVPVVGLSMMGESNKFPTSPFVHPDHVEDLRREMESFFLFQFPTRLPPLQTAAQPETDKKSKVKYEHNVDATTAMLDEDEDHHHPPDGHVDDEQKEESKTKPNPQQPIPTTTTTTISEVVTAPTAAGTAFDNTLVSARPGRIGKLVVYKSGKTILQMETPSGETIRMNVTEGLTCGFIQQAVLVDPQKKVYVHLGDVHKSAVVSPDLQYAFGE